jgi:hypothetical protein
MSMLPYGGWLVKSQHVDTKGLTVQLQDTFCGVERQRIAPVRRAPPAHFLPRGSPPGRQVPDAVWCGAVRCSRTVGPRPIAQAALRRHASTMWNVVAGPDATGAALPAPCLWVVHAPEMLPLPSGLLGARVPGLPVSDADVAQPLHRRESLACRGQRPEEVDGDLGARGAGPRGVDDEVPCEASAYNRGAG